MAAPSNLRPPSDFRNTAASYPILSTPGTKNSPRHEWFVLGVCRVGWMFDSMVAVAERIWTVADRAHAALRLSAKEKLVSVGGFAMLGKMFKALTDEMLTWQTEQFLKLEIGRANYTVYVEPKLVAEIAFNDIQISTRYPSGMALRFARVKRYRPDKTASEADTVESVRKLAGLA